ncbi:nitroreductase family protein [Verrucomicrobiota bacterium]
MDVFEAIAKRHSYRAGFEDRAIPREDLTKIVDAGIRAPSGCNAQTTSFVVVDDPGTLATLAEILDGKQVVSEAKAVIVCVCDYTPAYKGTSFAVEDCSAAVENMLLAITAMGYATVWLDGVLRSEDRATRIAELLGVPKEREVRIVLPLGVPSEAHVQKDRKPIEERAWFNRYGG